MDFWDTVTRGMDALANKLDSLSERTAVPNQTDSEFSVLNKDYCWEDLDYAGDEIMQRHIMTGECRIIDKYGQVKDRGTQEQLEQAMTRRQARLAAMRDTGFMVPPPMPAAADPYLGTDPALQQFQTFQPVQARYGDIIGVVRKDGAYEHYGIYVSDTCVIHYAIPASMTIGHATVHATSLRNFLRDDTEYFVLDFPKPYAPPVVIGSPTAAPAPDSHSVELAKRLQQQYGYHLYSPEETVKRAKSRLGETNYNIFTNNCEHFVIWCKTGVSESMQVTGMLHSLLHTQGWQFRKPALW